MSADEHGEDINDMPDGVGPRRARTSDVVQSALNLNERQHGYLEVFYELDQEAERRQQRRWHQNLHRDRASDWRWIPYSVDAPSADPTPAQQMLATKGIHDAGAGSTLAALFRRGLIDLRHVTIDTAQGPLPQAEVRLTPKGRAAFRASLPVDDNSTRLPDWLHDALSKIGDAPDAVLLKTNIGRTAARRLGAKGLGYIEDATPWSYRLTDEGRGYLDSL
ncbi:hypothetical protein AB0M48_11040 [Lentzea sp. NPDC051208]|uniref:hypothetical protein n=1 Tax=Lentzea sp. NPDC051208 TaxID=3154642 RepID=UPI00341FB82B